MVVSPCSCSSGNAHLYRTRLCRRCLQRSTPCSEENDSALDETMQCLFVNLGRSRVRSARHTEAMEEVLVATAREQPLLDVLRQGQEQRWAFAVICCSRDALRA